MLKLTFLSKLLSLNKNEYYYPLSILLVLGLLLSARANELLERVDRFDLPGFDVALDPARVLVEEEFRHLIEERKSITTWRAMTKQWRGAAHVYDR